ncbi:Undecaprenyl phosphate-alpha-4-amino-4-deoxy-L-arabinose arabinosyl transferase [Candidatus Calditenuaceae archaeon HR02]|nr:Undecaprenyl phosphate-alpha-4-amino-4-deoxy-L-arabinose arabinosyl transferase [Candidatus Calditenuaceae archaeon HR02]
MVSMLNANRILYIIALAGVVLAGIMVRFSNLGAESGWHDYDEGVHLSASLLLSKGYTPYIDFFFAHPPLSLHVLEFVVGDGGPQAYARARAISAMLGSATLIVLAAAAYMSVGKLAALIGTAFLALDGFASYNSRMVMLEPYVDFFLSVSVLSYVLLRKCRTPTQEAILSATSGLALGLSLSSKMSGLFGAGAILLHAIVSRRIRVSTLIFSSAIITYLLISSKYILAEPDTYLKQTILFHIVRPSDGIAQTERLRWMLTSILDLGVTWAGFPSLFLALLMAPSLVRSKLVSNDIYLWAMWSLSYIIAFSLTKTFFGHYIQHIITPLSYVIGVAVELGSRLRLVPWKTSITHVFLTKITPIWILSMALIQAGIISVYNPPATRDDTPVRVSQLLIEMGASHFSVIAFEPIYTFLSREYPSNMVIDSYGYMMYEGMGLGSYSFFEAILKYFSGELYSSWPIHEQKVQEKIVRDILDSNYIIIDWRARWQLTSASLHTVYQHITCIAKIRNIEICSVS